MQTTKLKGAWREITEQERKEEAVKILMYSEQINSLFAEYDVDNDISSKELQERLEALVIKIYNHY